MTRTTHITMIAAALLLVVAVAQAAPADDWPQFRGPASDGAVAGDLLKQLAIAWKVDLPGRGPSSPIVVNGRVIVTASSGAKQDLLHVLAFDAASGQPLWQRQFWATGRTFTHPQTSVAAPTPASDGKNVFAFFSSNDLAALDLDGNLLWYRGLAHDFPRLGNDVGMASSPLVVGEQVIVQSDSQGEAFVAGLNVIDGTTRWQLDRQREATWTSPAVLPSADGLAVLVEAPKSIAAINPASGAVLWSHEMDCDTISSACGHDGLVFVPGKGLTALRVEKGSSTPAVAWSKSQLQCGAASPTVSGSRLYAINRSGVLMIANTADGEILSRTRLEGNFWCSPIVAGNRVFAVSFEGAGQLVEVADDGASAKVIDKIPFDEAMQGSPAVAHGAVFVRGDKHLWKLAAPSDNQK